MKRFLTFLLIAFVGCTSLTNLLVDPKDDVQLGGQVDKDIHSKPAEYPIAYMPEMKSYVEGIVAKVLRSPEIKFRNVFVYRTEIIANDKEVNAFCTPGGYIYVYTGLLKFVDNEATLAGVLGHEIAHAERRHAMTRMEKAYTAQVLTAAALGQNPSAAAQIGANLFTGLGLLYNSRNDEAEADDYSFRYLRSTEYYPGAIKFFFEKIQNGQRSGMPGLERLLSTHPLPQDRVNAVNARLQSIGNPPATEANLFSARYQDMKRRMP